MRRAAHGQAVPIPADSAGAVDPLGTVGTETVRLTDVEGLIALAHPAPDARELRPVVGFR